MKSYDAIIIGGGAGLKIARPAANLGYSIAVIEKDFLGGTCLNRGCIPSKMLIHPADVIMQLKESDHLGIHLEGELKIDFQKLVHETTQTIDKESKSIIPLLENHKNIDLFLSEAKFIGPKKVLVDGKEIEGKKIFIAAGVRPYIPSIEGLEGTPFMTSTEMLRCENRPKKITIIGGGFIACELGHYLGAMGVEVQYISRSRFLRLLDDEIQSHFETIFSKRFPVTYGEPKKVSYENNTFTVYVDDKQFQSDALLVAAGVTPNSDLLDLQKTGVQINDRGFIKVNDYLETSEKDIYAFGDIIGRYLFRHTANFEGEYLLRSHFEDQKHKEPIYYPPVPYGVFTWPQVGGVGKLERELKKEGIEYIAGVNAYQNSAMGMALRKEEGLVKLLFDKKTLRLLGGHVIGEQATTMSHMIIAFMKMEATLKDLMETIYVHPALSENIRNAARKAWAQVK